MKLSTLSRKRCSEIARRVTLKVIRDQSYNFTSNIQRLTKFSCVNSRYYSPRT